MSRGLKRFAAIVACTLAALMVSMVSHANPLLEDSKSLLQQSLTIYEIDQEVARLAEGQKQTAAEIAGTEEQIGKQQIIVAETRERAGKVLRAYYTGQRDSLWLLLFKANSFADAISMFEYLDRIFKNDHRTLRLYTKSYEDLQALHANLVQTQTELEQTKQQFLAQRAHLVQLQQELDRQLADAPAAEALALKQQMEQLNQAWKNEGLPAFKKYLQATSDAMQHLTDFISLDQLKFSGFSHATLEISDRDLNEFFRAQNPVFENISWTFEDGHISIVGHDNQLNVSLKAHYVVVQEPENAMDFAIDELTYNQFTLPDTTRNELKKAFDLSFNPKKYFPILTVTGVEIRSGSMLISLKIG